MADIRGLVQSTVNSLSKKYKGITTTETGSGDGRRNSLDVVPRDLDGGVIGGSDAPSHTVIVDENGPLLTEDNPGSVVLRGTDGKIIDPVDSINVPSPTVLDDGYKVVTTAGTAVKLVTASIPIAYVSITAKPGNTGYISVGGATTTPIGTIRGDYLGPGDNTIVLVDDLNKVYINSSVNSEGVSFRYG